MAKKYLKNKRINPETGEVDYFFPMEIPDPSSPILEYARLYGLEIGWARLGNRSFLAVFVPCKDKVYDSRRGIDVYVDTPSDVQYARYLELIKDEMKKQDAMKQDGRCVIPDGRGGTKRCPVRVPNPAYIPGGDEDKTIPVHCEGCIFEPFRQAHTFVAFSSLDHESDGGGLETYEVKTPKSYYAADRYLELREEFVAFVKSRNPKLASLAEKLVDELTQSEASRELGLATSTVGSRTKKLKELALEFLDSIISL